MQKHMQDLKAEMRRAEKAARRNHEAHMEWKRLVTLYCSRAAILRGFASRAREAAMEGERRERLAREAAESRVRLVPRAAAKPDGRSDTLKF